MTEPKRFKKGKHTYTHWGHKIKEVRTEGKPKSQPENPQSQSVSIDVDVQTEQGVYANMVMVHKSPTEVICDFVFIQPGNKRGRVRSRVILPPKQADALAKLLGN